MNGYLPSVISSVRTDEFDRQIDQLFNEAMRAFGASDGHGLWAPDCNVWEDDNGFSIQMALPGWEPKDITLEMNNQVLTIKGERNAQQSEGRTYHLREIAEGRFARFFKLPGFVDQDKASATYKHGLLTVTFPKKEEAKPRQILIQGS
ncbi:MAG: Hsp20/alpha crystallin family protein [Nitrospira sp.]|nr:Hsp20/alpha crystallin family protein [Nitrospira sp.]